MPSRTSSMNGRPTGCRSVIRGPTSSSRPVRSAGPTAHRISQIECQSVREVARTRVPGTGQIITRNSNRDAKTDEVAAGIRGVGSRASTGRRLAGNPTPRYASPSNSCQLTNVRVAESKREHLEMHVWPEWHRVRRVEGYSRRQLGDHASRLCD
jgi:hypothetical protein